MEAETVKARMEHEYRMKEIEIRNRDTGAGGDAETNPNTNNNNSSRSAGMKALKLPPFNEDKDDLDAYLIRFERACTAFEVRQEHRSTQLARLLVEGKLFILIHFALNDPSYSPMTSPMTSSEIPITQPPTLTSSWTLEGS